MQKTQVSSLDQGDPLEEEMATHSSFLACWKPTDRGAWWATVLSVTNSQIWLSTHKIIRRIQELKSMMILWEQRMVVFHNISLVTAWSDRTASLLFPQSPVLSTLRFCLWKTIHADETLFLLKFFFPSFFPLCFTVPLSQAVRHLTYNRTACSVFTPQHFLNIRIPQMPAPSLFSQFCICLPSKAPL